MPVQRLRAYRTLKIILVGFHLFSMFTDSLLFVLAVCDPKSLLFLFGMQLDYSDALIGGGFSFKNPNATQTCGCGKSFAAEMWNIVYRTIHRR